MDNFLDVIIRRVSCKKHNADLGDLCFGLVGPTGFHGAVCNSRAKAGGFVGKISPSALSRYAPKREGVRGQRS